jgi:amidase
VIAQAPSFDTIGWFAREAGLLADVGKVLLGVDADQANMPRRLVIADDAFAVAEAATVAALQPAVTRLATVVGRVERTRLSSVPLAEWRANQSAIQGREAWATFGDWIDRNNPRFSFEVADNILRGARMTDAAVEAGKQFRSERGAELAALLDADTVVCLPTTPFPAPPRDQSRSFMDERRVPVGTLTCIAGMLGAPQVSLPVAVVDGLPVGLSILARPGADAMLLALARRIA